MKKQVSILFIIVFLAMLQFGYAQGNRTKNSKQPKWLPENGFWVIEGNVKTPLTSTICFYNNEKILVYKEKMEGIQINLKKRKVLRRLKNVLEQSITAWQVNHVTKENQMLVAAIFRKP